MMPCACRRRHDGAVSFGKLDRHRTETAASSLNKYFLSGLEMSGLEHGLPRREEDQREARGFLKAQSLRLKSERALADGSKFREGTWARGRGGKDLIPWLNLEPGGASSTTPAISSPSTNGNWSFKARLNRPLQIFPSTGLTPAALTRTSTSSGRRTGAASSPCLRMPVG